MNTRIDGLYLDPSLGFSENIEMNGIDQEKVFEKIKEMQSKIMQAVSLEDPSPENIKIWFFGFKMALIELIESLDNVVLEKSEKIPRNEA